MPTAQLSQKRQRSTIGFPYMDLESSKVLADAIHGNVGNGECDDDQLAAWTGQSSKSSTFRIQIYAARMFGILEGEGSSKHKLSELGRAIVDPNHSREARANAFLEVPLYRALFENHKGGVLPPAAALEREIGDLGVSEKQKEKARQVFERSADQAGFFEHGRSRLVLPGVAKGSSPTPAPTPGKKVENESSIGGGSGDGGNGPSDPLISALIQKLPKAGPWPSDDRVMWLQMVAMAFQMAYGADAQIEIKKSS